MVCLFGRDGLTDAIIQACQGGANPGQHSKHACQMGYLFWWSWFKWALCILSELEVNYICSVHDGILDFLDWFTQGSFVQHYASILNSKYIINCVTRDRQFIVNVYKISCVLKSARYIHYCVYKIAMLKVQYNCIFTPQKRFLSKIVRQMQCNSNIHT